MTTILISGLSFEEKNMKNFLKFKKGQKIDLILLPNSTKSIENISPFYITSKETFFQCTKRLKESCPICGELKMQKEPEYDDYVICPKCEGHNIISKKVYLGYNLCECETKCNICGHVDYWAYGFYMSKSY